MFCSDWQSFSDLKFFIFTANVPWLLYYSYIPATIISVLVGFFVYFKNRDSLQCKLLLGLCLSFAGSCLTGLIAWVGINSPSVAFFWIMGDFANLLVYFFSFYFSYVTVKEKDLPVYLKILFLALLFLFLYSLMGNYVWEEFDIDSCEVVEKKSIFLLFIFQAIISISTLIVLIVGLVKKKGPEKKQLRLILLGIFLFLITFLTMTFIGSYFLAWDISQYGNFGIVAFLGVLAYLIVRHQIFGIRLIAAQALVTFIAILVGSQFFFIRTPINRWLNGITFLLVAIFGWVLVRSVKREIKTRQEIELVSDKLASAYAKLKKLDNAKTEFISIASHQLRTPLTSIKGFMSMVMGGDYGKVPKTFGPPLEKIYVSNERLIKLVEDLLNISRIETGRLVFAFNQNDVNKTAQEVFDTMFIMAKNKNLKLDYAPPKKPIAPFLFDSVKMREVFSNLVDNSLKYTKQGWVKISLTETEEKVLFCVADSGMGIAKDELQYIFEKFQRGQEAGTVQSEGTGLGLYVCQKIVEAHKGRIWVESEGLGQGSRFFVELEKHFVPMGKG